MSADPTKPVLIHYCTTCGRFMHTQDRDDYTCMVCNKTCDAEKYDAYIAKASKITSQCSYTFHDEEDREKLLRKIYMQIELSEPDSYERSSVNIVIAAIENAIVDPAICPKGTAVLSQIVEPDSTDKSLNKMKDVNRWL